MVVLKKNALTALVIAFILFVASFILFFNLSYMGVRDRSVEQFIIQNFKLFILGYNLKILFFYIVTAEIMALFGFLLGIEKIRNIILFQFFFWFFFWIRGIKLHPQFFIEQLYNKGKILKEFQILITDRLPLIALYFMFAAILLLIAAKKRRWWQGILILSLAALFIVQFPVGSVKAQAGTAPNILIFGTDSLRPDRISYNGYQRRTPHIDSLFTQGANFLSAKSSLARTFSVFTSILTSTFPPEHRIRHMYPTVAERRVRRVNWVDMLNEKNYQTAVITDFAGDIFTRIDFGFKHIDAPHLTIRSILRQRSLEIHYFLIGFLVNPLYHRFFPELQGMPFYVDPYYLNQSSKRFIRDAVQARKPFFLLYFSSNNHFPYICKWPYYQLYTDSHYRGIHKYCKYDTVLKEFSRSDVPKDDAIQINALYDNGVKLFDDSLGDMLQFIKDCRIEKNTIVVILSDHGENLYENGYGIGHGDHLRGPYANNITFGIFSPFENFGGRRIEKTVRDIDIAPTLLDMVSARIPAAFRGHSLLNIMRGARFDGYPSYMETELWYTEEAPYIKDRVRVSYPDIQHMLEIEPIQGEIVLKKEFYRAIIEAKYKALQLNNKKYIFLPGNNSFKEEFYIDEKPVAGKAKDDPDFTNLKKKLIEMFADIFQIDPSGRIIEKIPKLPE